MNEDKMNMAMRKFLKEVGVTSQREMEKAVRGGIEKGTLKGNERLKARMTLTIDALNLLHVVDGEIDLE